MEETNEQMERCVEILTAGYVQSYVDFFYLINQTNADSESKTETNPQAEEKSNNQDDTDGNSFISSKLMAAEAARRSGDPSTVFENYQDLANYFSKKKQAKTAEHFWNKCCKLSELTNDIDGQKQATLQTGIVLSSIEGETDRAIQYHEKHLQLCIDSKDEIGCAKARKELTSVYDKYALELDQAGDINKSIYYLEQLLKFATASKDQEKKSMANFRLGKAFNKLKKPERAIVALCVSFDYGKETDDLKLQGESCAGLADAYLQIPSKQKKAIEYLQETRRLAQQTGDDDVQMHANKMLGSVFTNNLEHDQAVRFFESSFELSRKQAQLANVDRTRVLLGKSLANARKLELYKMAHACNLESLLAWKTTREFSCKE